MDVVPICLTTLLDESHKTTELARHRRAIVEADVIIGVDPKHQHEFTVFGTPSLEETVRLDQPHAMRTVRVTLDEDLGELDKLVQLVQELKGLRPKRRPR